MRGPGRFTLQDAQPRKAWATGLVSTSPAPSGQRPRGPLCLKREGLSLPLGLRSLEDLLVCSHQGRESN